MKTELKIENLRRAKATAGIMYDEPGADKDFWAMVNDDCDDEILAASEKPEPLYSKGRLIVMGIIAAILLAIFLSGCQTVKGVAGDTGWILTKMSDNIQIENERSK